MNKAIDDGATESLWLAWALGFYHSSINAYCNRCLRLNDIPTVVLMRSFFPGCEAWGNADNMTGHPRLLPSFQRWSSEESPEWILRAAAHSGNLELMRRARTSVRARNFASAWLEYSRPAARTMPTSRRVESLLTEWMREYGPGTLDSGDLENLAIRRRELEEEEERLRGYRRVLDSLQ